LHDLIQFEEKVCLENVSLTAMHESILITSKINASQCHDIITDDIPNAFVQTDAGQARTGRRIIMKIRDPFVDAPEFYEQNFVYKRKTKILYVHMLVA